MTARRRLVLPAVAGVVALALSACGFRTTGRPPDAMELAVEFDTVRNLVLGHAVRIHDVQVGVVTGITLDDDYGVTVDVAVERDLQLPRGTVAAIRKTSLLGEDYVDLAVPEVVPVGAPMLGDGDIITDTRVLPDLEDVTAQAEELIGHLVVQDLEALVDAAAGALVGRGPQLDKMLVRLDEVAQSYADDSERVGRIIDRFAVLGDDLAAGTDDITGVIDELSTATTSLTAQRDRIVAALEDLVELADATQDTLLAPQVTADFEQALGELLGVARTLRDNRAEVSRLLDGLNDLGGELPPVIEDDQLVLYGWLVPMLGGQPLLPDEGVSLLDLLEPPS